MPHVFISYSRKDLDHAQKIVNTLAANDLDTWTDWKSIPKGEDWWKHIKIGIQDADAFLFLISPDSAKSKICRDEIDHAIKNGKRILPILIRNVPPGDVHGEISNRNWILCRDGEDNYETAIKSATTAIHTDYEWVSYHSKLLNQAHAWEDVRNESSRLLRGKELREAEKRLDTATQKEPKPIDLQKKYVLASRKRLNRIKKISLVVAGTGVIVLSFLGLFAINQSKTAVINKQIALARQLARQANSQKSDPIVADLLAIQSLKLFSNDDAASFLLNNNFSYDFLTRFQDDDVAAIYGAAFSPDGKYVVSYGDDNNAHVWEASSGKLVARLQHEDWVKSVSFNPNGKYLISRGGAVHIWDTSTWNEVVNLTKGVGTSTVAISPDGKHIASSSNRMVHIWDTSTWNEVVSLTYDRELLSITFSPDGKYIASGGYDGSVRIWNINTGKEVANIPNDSIITFVAFSVDGKYIIATSKNGIIHTLDVTMGSEVALMTHDSAINSIAFSPDGKYIVSGSDDNTARIWEITSGNEVAHMIHNSVVNSVAFSPEGKYVASGSDDGTARVWEATSGNEVARMSALSGPVSVVAFSPDGKYIVSGHYQALVWVWQAEDLIANICAIIPRNLSLSEWQQYVVEIPYQAVCDPQIYPNAIIPQDAQQYLNSQKNEMP